MTPIGWFITAICVFVGIVVGYILSKYFPNLVKNKKIEEVIKDPHLLAEKLKAHREIHEKELDVRTGKMYDMGKELDIEVEEDKETGQDVVMVKETEVKKAKEIKKKVAEDKTKKKIKKKIKKKSSRKKVVKK